MASSRSVLDEQGPTRITVELAVDSRFEATVGAWVLVREAFLKCGAQEPQMAWIHQGNSFLHPVPISCNIWTLSPQ